MEHNGTDYKHLPKGTAIIRLARLTYSRLVRRKYQIKLENQQLLDQIDGPFLLLSNHSHGIDFIMLSSSFPFHLKWVTGAYLFKMNAFVHYVVNSIAQCIAKEQGKSDLSTIIEMKKALAGGSVVGLFPEGTRTWDGDSIPSSGSVLAKLVCYLKVPVMIVSCEGTYACKPRWAMRESKGPVFINLKALLRPSEFLTLKIEKLEEKLDSLLFFSNDQWQDSHHIAYKSDHKAEGLQRVLYACPKCLSIGTHTASGNRMKCSCCGAETEVDEFQKLHSEATPMTTVHQWHLWEQTLLDSPDTVFKPEEGVLLQVGDIDQYKTVSKHITISADSKAITVQCNDRDRKKYEFALNQITSIAINAKQTLEFFIGHDLFRIRLKEDGCALKYRELALAQQSTEETK